MKEWELIKTALNKANLRGVYDLNESNEIVQCIVKVEQIINQTEGNEGKTAQEVHS